MSLPRHLSGDINPLKKYTANAVRAPLVVSVRETLPCNAADNEEESEPDEDVEDRACEQDDSSSSLPSPVSMSAFLEQCQRHHPVQCETGAVLDTLYTWQSRL